MRELHQTRLELVSNLPMQCFGDTDVLGMMGLGEVYQSKDLEEFLGPEFTAIPSLFSQTQKLVESKGFDINKAE